MSQRQERFGKLIQAELATMIYRDIKDPRVTEAGGLVTITQVHVTADLGMARVQVTLHDGTPEASEALIAGLNRAAPFLRVSLRKRLDAKKTPELRFELDVGTDAADRVNEILADLKKPTG